MEEFLLNSVGQYECVWWGWRFQNISEWDDELYDVYRGIQVYKGVGRRSRHILWSDGSRIGRIDEYIRVHVYVEDQFGMGRVCSWGVIVLDPDTMCHEDSSAWYSGRLVVV